MKNVHIISIDESLCIGCGLCKRDCQLNVIDIKDGCAVVTTQECIKCGHCVAVCPENAVSMSGFEDEPEELTPGMRVDSGALIKQLKARRSMRHFAKLDVSPELVEKIIEAGRYTPSGSNKQDVSYVVLRDNKDEYEKIAISLMRRLKKVLGFFTSKFKSLDIDDNFLFKNAPVVIVVKSTSTVDGALAASTMELMAQSLGLGALYSGFFAALAKMSGKLNKMLSIKPGEKVVTALVIGYPAMKYKRTAPKERPTVIFD